MVLKMFIYALFTVILGSLAYGALSFYQEHIFLSKEEMVVFINEVNQRISTAFQQGYAVGESSCNSSL